MDDLCACRNLQKKKKEPVSLDQSLNVYVDVQVVAILFVGVEKRANIV